MSGDKEATPEQEWTVLLLTRRLKEQKRVGRKPKQSVELAARVIKATHSSLMSGNGGIDRLDQPTLGMMLNALMTGEEPDLSIQTKEKGRCRMYVGGLTLGFAWMTDQPVPAKVLTDTAKHVASFDDVPLVWDEGEPK